MKIRQIGPLVPFLLPLFGLGECALNGGCVVVLRGNDEIGFKQSSTWGFYQETEINDEGKQEAYAEVRGTVFDWLFRIFTPDDQPAPDPTGNDDATGPAAEPEPPGP